MKKWLESYAAILKSLGAFALCFVMLFTVTGMAEGGMNEKAEKPVSSVLKDFGSINISFNPTLQNSDYLTEGQKVIFSMQADEQGKNVLFDPNKLTHQLPENGLTYMIVTPENGLVELEVTDYGTPGHPSYKLRGWAAIDDNGLLTITWDKDPETSPGWQYIDKANNLWFNLSIEATVNGNTDVITLDNNLVYYIDNTASVTFTKSIDPPEIKDKLLGDSAEAEAARNEYVFTTTVTQAKTSTNVTGEYVKDGVVRDAQGHIVYEKKTITFTLDDMQYDQRNGFWYKDFDNLKPEPNEVLTVTETANKDYSAVGYTYTSTASSCTTAAGLEKFSNQTITLSNDYEQDKVKLVINKVFDSGSAILGINITPEQKGMIRFVVEGESYNGDEFD